jgi:hypothetical protein
MRRTDRNIHAGMVIMVRRSPVVDFEKTALSVCLRERFHHIVVYIMQYVYFILYIAEMPLNADGNRHVV